MPKESGRKQTQTGNSGPVIANLGNFYFKRSTINIGTLHKPQGTGRKIMKSKDELETLIGIIAAPDSPVGIDALYVHALILDQLEQIQTRLGSLESKVRELNNPS
jgi:hypothetical protein